MATSPTVDEYENSHARIHVIGHSETTYRVGAVNLTSHEVEAPGITRPWIRHTCISNRVGTLGSGHRSMGNLSFVPTLENGPTFYKYALLRLRRIKRDATK